MAGQNQSRPFVLTLYIHLPYIADTPETGRTIGDSKMTTATVARNPRPNERRDTTINLRVTAAVRNLIDKAADTIGKTRTEFVLDSAKKHAIDVLLDQRLFALNEEQWAEFTAALDNPPLPNDQLKKLMARKAPWET